MTTLTHHLTHTEQQLSDLRKTEARLQTELTQVQTKIASHELAISILTQHDNKIEQRDSQV